jgi:hypothetical protein
MLPTPAVVALPATARNVILLMGEDSSVAVDKRLPIDHVAAAIEQYLSWVDPITPLSIVTVSSPIDVLRQMGAFDEAAPGVRYFVFLGHAWHSGLILKNYKDGTDYATAIHDAAVWDEIATVYGPDVSWPDDVTQYKTNQLRVSNLRNLPYQFVDNLRRVFAGARGIYVLGCNAADPSAVGSETFVQTLADTSANRCTGRRSTPTSSRRLRPARGPTTAPTGATQCRPRPCCCCRAGPGRPTCIMSLPGYKMGFP